MNESQADELIQTLREMRDLMKPQEVIIKELIRDIRPESTRKLLELNDLIKSNDFWNSLTREQRDKILELE